MFDKIRSSVNRRFRVTAMAGVAMIFFTAGICVSGMLDRNSRAEPDPAVVQSQGDPQQPAVTSPFTALAERCMPSVVYIKVTKVEAAGLSDMQAPPPFRDFFGHPWSAPDRPVQGAGSGVIISKDGYILTNNHVVDGAREVLVTTADQREFKAQIVGGDPKTDLAILKIEDGEKLPAASIGDSDMIKVGDWVIAIGNPFGLSHTVTSGIISAKGRVIGAGPYDDFIQTDASINPGNSGGPLFNMKGEVIGINTAIVPNGQGIGFSIPVNTAKPLIPQLVANGQVTRGYLGVNIQSITPELSKAMKLEKSNGALVAEVVPGGPAEKAGIRAGDVIVSFDGKSIHDSHDLPAVVAAAKIGKEAPVTVLRNGNELRLTAVVAKLESGGTRLADGRSPAGGKLGLRFEDLDPETARQLGLKEDHGVVVAGVHPGSPAHQASIQPGDVIVEVNRQAVRSASDLREKIAETGDGGPLLLLLKNARGSRYVVLKG